MEKQIEEVYVKHRQEMQRLERYLDTVNEIKNIKKQVNILEPKLKATCELIESIQDIP